MKYFVAFLGAFSMFEMLHYQEQVLYCIISGFIFLLCFHVFLVLTVTENISKESGKNLWEQIAISALLIFLCGSITLFTTSIDRSFVFGSLLCAAGLIIKAINNVN